MDLHASPALAIACQGAWRWFTYRGNGRECVEAYPCRSSQSFRGRGRQVVRQRSAKPLSAVRFRLAPPIFPILGKNVRKTFK